MVRTGWALRGSLARQVLLGQEEVEAGLLGLRDGQVQLEEVEVAQAQQAWLAAPAAQVRQDLPVRLAAVGRQAWLAAQDLWAQGVRLDQLDPRALRDRLVQQALLQP